MTKQEFINKLKMNLSSLPEKDIEDQLNFYIEMIDDRIEEGLDEEEAVSQIGDIDKITDEIYNNISLFKIAKEKLKPERKIKTWELILIIVGSPIWLSLLIAMFAVILSLYIVLWALIIVCWALFVSFAASSIGAILLGLIYTIMYQNPEYLIFISAGLVLIGLSILTFYGSTYATKGLIKLSKKIPLLIKKAFMKKRGN